MLARGLVPGIPALSSAAASPAELSEYGVHFLTVDPGEMNTRMHAAAIPDADPATLSDAADIAAPSIKLPEVSS